MVGARQRRLGVEFLVEHQISQRVARFQPVELPLSSSSPGHGSGCGAPENLGSSPSSLWLPSLDRLAPTGGREDQSQAGLPTVEAAGLVGWPATQEKTTAWPGLSPQQAEFPHHVWAYDFLEDAGVNGQKLRLLTIVDEFTRECVAIEVAGSFNARQVIGVLEILIAQQGAPRFLRSDNGPEFMAQALQRWLADKGIGTFYIQPGSPWQNAYAETFNGKFRDECLNMELFLNRTHAHQIIQTFRQHYTPSGLIAAWNIKPRRSSKRSGRLLSWGLCPQTPRVFRLLGHPKGRKTKGRACGSAPRYGHRTRRSGRSPALPYPPLR
jgi:putative transposase